MEKAAINNNSATPGIFSWIKRNGSMLLFILATVLAISASWFAAQQKPHWDAFRVTHPWYSSESWLSSDFWLYPVERNAFKRLPVIRSSLNDVFALGDRVWVVGDGGLIIHSDDGGITWQQQFVDPYAFSEPRSQWNWMSESWARDKSEPTDALQTKLGERSVSETDNQSDSTDAQQKSDEPNTAQQLKGAAQVNPKTVGELQNTDKVFKANLKNVFFTDVLNGWAVGDEGTIISTADGGKIWQQQASETDVGLRSITFVDSNRGWAVGDGGTILSAVDGGKTWQQQASGTGEELNSITFVDSTRGWAVGDKGTILSTADGGKTWQQQASRTGENLNSITFVDSNRGWAVGYNGTILSTTDGGKTWQSQTSETNARLNSILFIDSTRGWAVGGNLSSGAILSTTDGGKSWQKQENRGNRQLSSITFIDSHRGWAVDRGGNILSTTDSGETWQIQTNGWETRIPNITFIDNNRGWAVSGTGTILSTADGGKNWKPQVSGAGTPLYSITAIDSNRSWAVGERGKILSTTDGGKNWQVQDSGTDALLTSITFVDSHRGWIVGGRGSASFWNGTILSTTDGGKTWQVQDSGTDSLLTSITFIDSHRGWVVDGTIQNRKSYILSTTDGGKSWRKQESGMDAAFVSITFIDSNRGWAAGGNFGSGAILSTTDGGKTWLPQASETPVPLSGITFVDRNNGWAVGRRGNILSTADGGKTWQAQESGTDAWLAGITFIDSNHGWVAGSNGTILSTTDGGKSWRDIEYDRYPAPWFYAAMLLVLLLYAITFGLRTRQTQQDNQQQSVQSIANLGVTDKPAGPGQADLVGSRQIAIGLTRFLTNENTQPPLTIAITGEWGSGKSSVMNYLFANLKREGLRPVWFNAWHHRDEQNVLASMLANIHQQAIRPWWHPAGIWFRLRMLWRRHWLWKLAALFTLLSTAFMLTWLIMTPDKWKDTQRYLLFLANIEQPVVFGENGFKQLCTNWATEHDVGKDADEISTGALHSADWVMPKRKPDRLAVVSQQKVQHAIHESDYFSEAQCAILHTLHSHQHVKRNELNCHNGQANAVEANACFSSPKTFLKLVEQKLDVTLTHVGEKAIVDALENLSPESPVPFTREVVSLITALFAALTFFVFKGMTLLGFAPVQMMQGILRQSGMVAQTGEKVGTRMLFERHFKLITGLLGKRRLVLFIDDLDRCDKEHTRQVLEMTNFLSSSGELFIVLGMAPRYVLANVTLSYKDLAQAVHEADRLNGNDNGNSKGKGDDQEFNPGQSWFAQHYLQKLIHIEVPVPKPENAQILALLSADGKSVETDNELEKNEQREQRVDHVLGGIGKIVRIVLLVGAMGFGVYLGNPAWHQTEVVQVEGPVIAKNNQLLPNTDVPKPPADMETGQQSVEPDAKESSGPVFKPGIDRFDSSPLWLGLGLMALLVTLGMGLFWIMRRLDKLDNHPSVAWLKPLLHRLKVMLFGPESTQDSQNFVDALQIWHPLIAQKNPTPRTIKAFVNRLRYMANRSEFSKSSTDSVDTINANREAHLVAVAAIYYCYESDIDNVLGNLEVYLADEIRPSHNRFEERWPGLAMALSEHFQAFGAYPSRQDFAFYQAMNADICIHRQA